MSQRKNPYVGPRTFGYQDREWFFGRPREARRLLARVISQQLVLFYAQSGAGKSSLINTRLIPQLEENGFAVLPVGRVGGGLPPQIGKVDNIFSFNLMLSLNQGGGDLRHFSSIELPAFLTGLPVDGGRPHVLIVDQFEQILTTHPDRWEDREGFFKQLNDAMLNYPRLSVVLVVREDYVAPLEPYAPLLKDQMRARFYMQRLSRDAALEAITMPAKKAHRPFAEKAAEQLRNELCQVRVPGEEKTYGGEFVDPILLQVVCYQLWENLRDELQEEITFADLKRAGDIGSALRGYYEDAIRKVINKFNISEKMVRNWFEEQLITPDKTRSIVRQEDTTTAGLENEAVRVLVDQFVLRPMVRTGTTWYELTHDRLVEPILKANQHWKEIHQESMVEKWEYVRREHGDLYLSAEQLIPVDVYVQDPYVARENEGLAFRNILLECEPELTDGPTSSRIAVVDYDGDEDYLEKPARWDGRNKQFYFERDKERIPITRAHRNLPQFHQVNVWAIIQSVLNMYEAPWVLGRSVPWAFEGNRLIVMPHAGYLANAFYSRPSKSIQFHYFGPPDQRVYTCLSHDIIAHETGHAILDGLRPLYFENSSLQTAAFHESVADLTAIMISLLNNRLRWKVAEDTKGELLEDTIIAALAEEFGRYTSGRPHLRSARSKKTMADVVGQSSPYPWSEVLTGAMWQILAGMVAKYQARPKKSTGKLPSDREALLWAVNRFRRVAFQPLDYLPPADVQFSDYAKAVLKADELVDPVDQYNFRGLMKEVFTERGIDFAPDEAEAANPSFYGYDIDRVSRSRTDAYHFLHENRRQLCIPCDQDITIVDLYHTDKTVIGGRKLPREVVLQYAWREDVPLKGSEFGKFNGEVFSMLCGGTLVLDSRGNLRHWVRKPGSRAQKICAGKRRTYCGAERARGRERRKQFLEYIASRIRSGRLRFSECDKPWEIDTHSPMITQRAGDGSLRMETTPHMRHWTEE